jgi:hypothetical protein
MARTKRAARDRKVPRTYRLSPAKLEAAQRILGTPTATETIEAALEAGDGVDSAGRQSVSPAVERKYVLDSNLFIRAFRNEASNAELQRFHQLFAPFEYLSAAPLTFEAFASGRHACA